MEKLNKKYNNLIRALTTLEEATNDYKLITKKKELCEPELTYSRLYKMSRDSMIQRFGYSIELFWKCLKLYLETSQVLTGLNVPAEVIRECYSLSILNQEEAETILQMIKDRNMTSHIYVEEIAEYLSKKIPECYTIMNQVSKRLNPIK